MVTLFFTIGDFDINENDFEMELNGKSQNIGEYGVKPNKEHSNALNVVKDWGSNV